VKAKADPQQVSGDFFDLLGKIITVLKSSKGELTVEGITAKQPDGETLVALKKVTLAGALGGLGGNAGALRLTIVHEGLTLAPSLLPAPQVPRRVVIDFGLEAIDGGVLRKIAETAAKLSPDASDDERRQTTIQILALTMSLQPVFRLYEAAVDFRDVSVEASGEAKRAPPAPIGFATTADIAVHNFDGLSEVLTSPNDRAEASLLKFIGEPGSNAAGDSVLKFHVTWGLGDPFKINGNDFSQRYVGSPANPRPPPSGEPRVLRPTGPPLTGDDVRAVQKALGVSKTNGVYDTTTALAVMRFQKANGLDVNGVVDGSVRDKLGITLPPTPKMIPKN
jgi:hypothetical protein